MKPITLTLSGILIILKVFGQEYFQQEVNYRIEVELDDRKHELTGQETITYINNSPDTLTFLYFHLWPNAYKNRHTALTKQQVKVRNKKLYMASEQDRGYIDNLDFDVDGKKINLIYDPVYNDICRLILYDPLPPGRKIVISTPFRVKIPSADFSRLGHSGNSYQVTQWYPKPAVYDNEGWHRMPYLDMGEFYSEFGSFDVSITLPGNYVVAATGNCRTASETKWLDSLARVTAAIEKFDRRNDMFPPSSERKKTLRYTEQNIHDFAWFADKRFHVLKGEVEVPHSGKKVTTWAMFTNSKARYWQRALEYINDAVYYYSLWSGDYPYANCTAVDAPLSAGGGMEYPTITVIGKSDSHLALEQVIMHEVGHNWFYGVLGSDERTHPWMDEGINTFYEHRYIKTKYPETKAGTGLLPDELISFLGLRDLPPEAVYELGYVINARRNLDQPSTLASEEYSAMNYFTTVYMKTAFLFDYLKE
ncbi:MAG: M1 family metallopeptidase, partial [Bacteroidetes bacterium]|nr:M1 family metallopeptidase [Bacteroidota bacterium]